MSLRDADTPPDEARKTSPQLTRAEFDRLLTECMDTYAQAVRAHVKGGSDYDECRDKAAQARAALTDAVFPQRKRA